MPRIFFALWPDDEVRERLYQVSNLLPAGNGRLVPRQNLHITLLFLGNVDEESVGELIRRTDSIRRRNFSLTFDHCGWWKKPRVIWMAPSIIPDDLLKLVKDINSVSLKCGLGQDIKPYLPHLTIARKAGKPGPTVEFSPICWNINEFCLVESVTFAQGAQYRVIQGWPLSSA